MWIRTYFLTLRCKSMTDQRLELQARQSIIMGGSVSYLWHCCSCEILAACTACKNTQRLHGQRGIYIYIYIYRIFSTVPRLLWVNTFTRRNFFPAVLSLCNSEEYLKCSRCFLVVKYRIVFLNFHFIFQLHDKLSQHLYQLYWRSCVPLFSRPIFIL